MKTEHRSFEIRLAEDQDRTGPGLLEGVLLVYETRASDRAEVFAKDSLHWPDDGVVLREQHNRSEPIVRFIPELTDNELRVRIRLPDTQRGRDAAVSVKNGTLRGLSVEFRAEKEGKRSDGCRYIQRAALVGAGLVDDPSYAQSLVEVRKGRSTQAPKADTLWL